MSYAHQHVNEAIQILQHIDIHAIEKMADLLTRVKQNEGRIFFLGVGGSAGNCSHAVNDFRKIVGIEAYAPTDNVSELTARTNDEGWPTVFEAWLRTSRANEKDAVMVLSVGGGDTERNVSVNIVRGLIEAKKRGLTIYGIVGRDGGYTKRIGDEVIVVPTIDPKHITPHSESFQSVICHCIVSHPNLMAQETKWEGLAKEGGKAVNV